MQGKIDRGLFIDALTDGAISMYGFTFPFTGADRVFHTREELRDAITMSISSMRDAWEAVHTVLKLIDANTIGGKFDKLANIVSDKYIELEARKAGLEDDDIDITNI